MSENTNSISISLSSLLVKYSSQPANIFREYQEQNDNSQYGIKSQKQSQSYGCSYLRKDQDRNQRDREIYSQQKSKIKRHDQMNNDEEELDQYFDILLEHSVKNDKDKQKQKGPVNKIEANGWQESARKIFTPAKPKKQKQKKTKQEKQKLQFIHPTSSLVSVSINRQKMVNEIKQSLEKQDRLNEQASKLGIKPIKTLGAVRCKRQMQYIMEYMETGAVPQGYMDKLEALMNS